MKKKLLFTLMFAFIGVNYYAQPGSGGTSGSCASTVLGSFATCLSNHGVSYYMVDAGDEIYLYGTGSPPPGQITSCMVQYDNDRSSCPEAPVVIDKTGIYVGKTAAR
jgi:hypothetical protein